MVDPSSETAPSDKSLSLSEKVKCSLEALRQTFQTYAFDEVFIAFNGGKDCTVLMHLVDRVLRECCACDVVVAESGAASGLGGSIKRVLCLYMKPMDPFEEVEQFVDSCPSVYSIQLEQSRAGNSVQESLFELCAEHPRLKAALMGCRRSDPWCGDLKTFERTSEGWPDLMRVNPLLDWNCADIWDYIQLHNVPYCSLYDIGYTSLGEKTNTLPNPHLGYIDEKTGETKYRPAYHLKNDDALERVGRIKPAKRRNNQTSSSS